MKLKLLKDKNKAIAEAKELILALQTIENKYMFSELHYADKDIRQQGIGLHVREAIEQASELIITLEGLTTETDNMYDKISRFKLIPSFDMPNARALL